MIPLFKPVLGRDELLAIADSFNTGWLGKGRKVDEFEAAWASHIRARPEQVVSVNSCTEGLFTAVKLLGIGPGDEVIIPAIHFSGTAQAVLSAGARPVFCDVDKRTLNTSAEMIAEKITDRTRAVILNHYGGVPCDMDYDLFKAHPNVRLIEDAACAPASTYRGQAVGTLGDVGVWSFDAMKIISTGDGGMMYIRDEGLARKARKLLYLGTSTESGSKNDRPNWWEFEVEIPGARRAVMNDLAAGMGLEQLKKLPQFIENRLYLSAIYTRSLPVGDIIFPPPAFGECEDSFYFYWIQTPRRNELAQYLRERDCYTTFKYWPLHLVYRTGVSLPNAEWAAQNTLLLPLHQGLTDSQVEYICGAIKKFFED